MQLVRFHGQRASLSRTEAHIRQDGADLYEFVAPLHGEVVIAHNNRTIRLRVGQFTLVDGTRPLRFEHADPLTAVTLALPQRLLHERLQGLDDACGDAFGTRHPLVKPALSYLGAVSEAMSELDEASLRRAGSQLLDLFAMVMDGEGDLLSTETAVQAAALRRIKRFIRGELGNDALSLSMIAAAAGVSVRHVQTLFQRSGSSAREYILQERLRQTRDDLMDARRSGASVTQIAMAAGFRNMSHFSTAFRRAYGCTPSDVRPSPKH
jgi:AraC-like DNA-binding protein